MKHDFILDILIVIAAVFAVLLGGFVLAEVTLAAEAATETTEAVISASRAAMATVSSETLKTGCAAVPGAGEAEDEDISITAALVAEGYLSDEVPLSYELQDVLRTACEEFGVGYPLALAVMERETQFQMVVGDGGEAVGYFQVWPRWWSWLMEDIGVTDINDPAQNIRTGCAVLGYLLETYGNETDALTAYNSGAPGTSEYATAVLDGAVRWENILKEENK